MERKPGLSVLVTWKTRADGQVDYWFDGVPQGSDRTGFERIVSNVEALSKHYSVRVLLNHQELIIMFNGPNDGYPFSQGAQYLQYKDLRGRLDKAVHQTGYSDAPIPIALKRAGLDSSPQRLEEQVSVRQMEGPGGVVPAAAAADVRVSLTVSPAEDDVRLVASLVNVSERTVTVYRPAFDGPVLYLADHDGVVAHVAHAEKISEEEAFAVLAPGESLVRTTRMRGDARFTADAYYTVYEPGKENEADGVRETVRSRRIQVLSGKTPTPDDPQ